MKHTPKDTKQAEANRIWRGDTAIPKDKVVYVVWKDGMRYISYVKHKKIISDTKRQTAEEDIKLFIKWAKKEGILITEEGLKSELEEIKNKLFKGEKDKTP